MRTRAVLLLALVAVGCSCDREPPPARPGPVDPAPTDPPAPPDPPTLAEPREVRVQTEDGVTLVGDLRASDPAAPLVVLVHQLGSTRAEWQPLVRRLGPDFNTYAFDLRGHGQSTQRGEETIDHASFAREDWAHLGEDVRDVLGHLREEEGLQPRRVAIVGSSIGSSAAILAAARDLSVNAVVALSPGRAYRGIDAITPLVQLGDRPLLVVAARGEPPSAEAAQDMARIAPEGELVLVEGDRHGVAMFESSPELIDRVVGFLREQLVE